jgi:outer membrane protein OmpA-like peptidoglycan-associated protein
VTAVARIPIVALVAACGSAPPPPPDNQAAPAAASVDTPSPACRAAVTRRYPPGRTEYVGSGGQRVVFTTSDQCGLVIQPVYFARETTTFQQPIVDELAGMLACRDQIEHSRLEIAVIGYTSSDEHDREALAVARSKAVIRYLVACGAPSAGFDIEVGSGTSRPDPTATNADDRDRRVDFVVIQQKP